MKLPSNTATIVALLFSILTFAAFTKDDWDLAKHKNGIKVYTRSITGKSIKEFRAMANVACSIQKLERILDDIENYPVWQKECAEIKVLDKIDAQEQYTYFEIDMPFPLSNRDMITHIVKEKDAQTGIVTYYNDSAPNYYPEQKGKVRMRESKGKWILTPISSSQTQLIYQFYGEPGNLPAWVVNAFIVDSPYRTITNLKKLAE